MATSEIPVTEFDFVLPLGYVDQDGQVHKHGRMRLARANDEIAVAQDPRVQASEAYFPIVLLSRVVTQLGALDVVTPNVIAQLFASDFLFLEELYGRVNDAKPIFIEGSCPHCQKGFRLQLASFFASVHGEESAHERA